MVVQLDANNRKQHIERFCADSKLLVFVMACAEI